MRRTAGVVCCLILCLLPAPASTNDALNDLDLEQLLDVEAVTASRRPEPLSRTPGAVTVLDEEDIFHSGATSLPELLRLVPGAHVAQVDTDKWAIGIRGFNGVMSNKHLVMVDGRPVTSPITTGVEWGNLIPVSMVKRVEVVRGGWSHLWGSDSLTGVINIITKTAEETQGGQSVTTVGTSGGEQLLRYGETLADNGFWRGYAAGGYATGHSLSGDGADREARDWGKGQGGFRADWENAYTDLLTLQGDLFYSSIEDNGGGGPSVYDSMTRRTANGSAQFTWNRATGLDSFINLRTSYARETMSVSDLNGHANIVYAEMERAVEQRGAHRLTWGVGGRYYWSNVENGQSAQLSDTSGDSFTSSAYLQDRIELVDDSLFLTLGGKLDYFGRGRFEVQPSIRLLQALPSREYWVAVSRAVRTENSLQRGGTYTLRQGGTTYTITARDGLKPEQALSYEAGMRHRSSPDFVHDVSLYVNDYSNLILLEFDDATNTAEFSNDLEGTAYGVEYSGQWRANGWLQLKPIATVMYQELNGQPVLPSNEAMPEQGVGGSVKLHALTKTSKNTGLDVLVGYVDGPTDRDLAGHLTLDVHGSWRASKSFLVEVVANNLGEWTEQRSRLRVGPSVDMRLTWNF